jgi:arylsulfatase A-like enzyme
VKATPGFKASTLALVLSAAVVIGCGPEAPPGPVPGVVLVVLDTVRADHLSCYGYERETSPNLDRVAAEGEIYLDAWAQAPWTLPAVATILTGQPPRVHGAGRGRDGLRGIRPEIPTLAEHLSAAGYRTAAFFSVVFCGPRFGFGRGFGRYDFRTSDAGNRGQRQADAATDAALEWLRHLDGEPFFLVVHYFDPHLTYDPPPPWDSIFDSGGEGGIEAGFGSASQVFDIRDGSLELTPRQRDSLVARYDGEIRFADEQLGRLRGAMEELGLWEDSLVVVVGDHGEEFWDHGGFEHGHSHHRELLRVPLVVRGPGREAGTRRAERVSQLDIVPTVLAAAAVPLPPDLAGRPLGSGGGGLAAEAEGSLWGGDLISIRDDSGTLILDRTTGSRRYFGPEDPLEQRDRWPDGPAAARALERVLLERPSPEAMGEAVEPTPEELEALRSLGYLE